MFKDILIYVTPVPTRSEAVASYAAALGAAYGAEAHGIGFRFEQSLSVPELPSNFNDIMRDLAARETADAETAFAEVAKIFAARGVPFTSQLQVTHTADAPGRFATQAHARDIVVLPNRAQKLNVEGALIEGVLFDSGRPQILVPEQGRCGYGLGHVLVAWDDSGPAARVLSSAVPLLVRAGKVSVVTVGEDARDARLTEVTRHLARHGIGAEAVEVERKGRRVGEALLSHAEASGVDLVVMGGYGHSRLREFVLGGATRTLIDAARLPVFMAR